MAEYIEREALLSELYSKQNGNLDIMLEIARFPAADVAPVVHGKWEWNPNAMDFGLGAWVCNKCGCKNNNLGLDRKMNPLMFSGSSYCPNCGADMRGEKNDL